MRRRETFLYILILVAMAFIGQFFAAHPRTPQTIGQDERSRLLALLATLQEKPLVLDSVLKNTDCEAVGPLPDHTCTPGAIYKDAATSTICVSGYTQTVRNVPVRVKRQVYANYGIAYPQKSGTYELDHLIPLSLGGNNSVANLFPEAASPTPGFKEKDVVENYLHESVCRGDISLGAAQKQIAENWLTVYDLLSTSTVQRLKAKYGNWSESH